MFTVTFFYLNHLFIQYSDLIWLYIDVLKLELR